MLPVVRAPPGEIAGAFVSGSVGPMTPGDGAVTVSLPTSSEPQKPREKPAPDTAVSRAARSCLSSRSTKCAALRPPAAVKFAPPDVRSRVTLAFKVRARGGIAVFAEALPDVHENGSRPLDAVTN
jgi:hypothetical protein